MTRRLTGWCFLVLAVAGTACGKVEQQSSLQTPTGRELVVGVGEAVFRVEKTRDLPNAFGNADLYGRRVAAGHKELLYLGLVDEETAAFQFVEENATSTETTVSRANGAGHTESQETVNGRFTQNIRKHHIVYRAGVEVRVVEATESHLRYSLSSSE